MVIISHSTTYSVQTLAARITDLENLISNVLKKAVFFNFQRFLATPAKLFGKTPNIQNFSLLGKRLKISPKWLSEPHGICQSQNGV